MNHRKKLRKGAVVMLSDFDSKPGRIIELTKEGSVIQLRNQRRIICSRMYTEQFVRQANG